MVWRWLILGLFPLAWAETKPAIVLELFTSQGCYSCPPAEELLAEAYLDVPDLLALELHVDYWDDLVYRGSNWADPFSSPIFSLRQRVYAEIIGRGPFTPQAIVQGAYSSNGAAKDRIDFAIDSVRGIDLTSGWQIDLVASASGWQAEVVSVEGEADAIAVVYQKEAVTEIGGGENKGKTLANHNVVTQWVNVGAVSRGQVIALGEVEPGFGCALILQRPDQGVVLGAWRCPG